MAETRFFEDKFCPITKGPCRTDCNWIYSEIEITEDGITEENECAVNMVVNALLELEYIDE